MKYDLETLPLGSIARARAQLAKLDLLKGLKTCRNGNIQLDSVQAELRECLERLYSSKTYGVILSGYYTAGEFGQYSVEHLLRRLYESHDFPTLLKQAYRFDAYAALITEIDEAWRGMLPGPFQMLKRGAASSPNSANKSVFISNPRPPL